MEIKINKEYLYTQSPIEIIIENVRQFSNDKEFEMIMKKCIEDKDKGQIKFHYEKSNILLIKIVMPTIIFHCMLKVLVMI